ncbi:HARB1-like protein [Mya arenaria]|uniref:HARB1-like protein n=1 Tax=Mya arenaria TaxID=6604 RepID=A0ABY7F7M2_MYAAR|nr:HARB1-like protein [Mya arenaria]
MKGTPAFSVIPGSSASESAIVDEDPFNLLGFDGKYFREKQSSVSSSAITATTSPTVRISDRDASSSPHSYVALNSPSGTFPTLTLFGQVRRMHSIRLAGFGHIVVCTTSVRCSYDSIDWQSRAWGMYEVACEAEVDEIEGIETQVNIPEYTKDMPFCDIFSNSCIREPTSTGKRKGNKLNVNGIVIKPRTLKEVQTAYYVESTAAKKSVKKFFDAATYVLTLLSEKFLKFAYCTSKEKVYDVVDENPMIVRQSNSFPTDAADQRKPASIFEGIENFPKLMGLIYGTHIRTKGPSEDEYMYVHRKQFHSINVQVVVDGDDKINDIVARWPGSVHLYRILRGSGLSQLLDNGPGSPGSSIYLVIAAILVHI